MEINVFDTKIHYSRTGCGQQIIIFIGGLGSFEENLNRQLNYFKNEFTVLTFDPPGLGRSERTGKTYTIKSYSDFLAEFLNQLNISKANFVGISLGGAIVLEAGINHPGIVERLVVANMDSSFEKALYFLFKYGIKLLGVKGFSSFISKSLFKDNKLRDEWVGYFNQNDKKSLLLGSESLRNWDVTNSLEMIAVPLLVIASDSEVPTPEVKMRHFSKVKDLKLVTIKNSSHVAYLEHSDEFNEVIKNFIGATN